MATPTLRSRRLVLRPFGDQDRAAFAAINADPRVMEHFPHALTAAQSDALVDRIALRWDTDGVGLWAVERIDSGQFIGFNGLAKPSFATPFGACIEVGWRLAADHWGHGFAPEAALAALDWGFANVTLPNDEIVSFTSRANLRSQRVMDKIGLRRDPGRDFEHPMYPAWDGRHHVVYSISRATHHGTA